MPVQIVGSQCALPVRDYCPVIDYCPVQVSFRVRVGVLVVKQPILHSILRL